jgi:putative sterol carrier protein
VQARGLHYHRETPMKYHFPSDEWVKAYRDLLNTSAAYEEASKNWDSDLIFIIEPDTTQEQIGYLYLDPHHGKCREARALAGLDEQKAAYVVNAPFSIWRRIIENRLDPIQALMTRQIKVKGDLMKIMRYPKAVKEMLACVTTVPTEFD